MAEDFAREWSKSRGFNEGATKSISLISQAIITNYRISKHNPQLHLECPTAFTSLISLL